MLYTRRRTILGLLILVFCLTLPMACDNTSNVSNTPSTPKSTPSDKVDDEVAVLDTDAGRIVIEFFPGDAPKHVENFKKLAKEKFYDGTGFHRIIPGTIIQGGDPNSKNGPPESWGTGQPNQPMIQAEFNARKHVRGIVSAARRGDNVNSATSQFFICESAKPEWDGQYTIFGRVVEGMNIVGIISGAPTVDGTDRPKEKINIKQVTLAKRTDYGATPTYK